MGGAEPRPVRRVLLAERAHRRVAEQELALDAIPVGPRAELTEQRVDAPLDAIDEHEVGRQLELALEPLEVALGGEHDLHRTSIVFATERELAIAVEWLVEVTKPFVDVVGLDVGVGVEEAQSDQVVAERRAIAGEMAR